MITADLLKDVPLVANRPDAERESIAVGAAEMEIVVEHHAHGTRRRSRG